MSVSLAPKYNNEQKGTLYEAHDYKRIGEIADYVILMTYEWGYTFGPSMPVSPLNEVKKVLEYAITEIEPSKIRMGIPTYGYDFVVPYKEGNKATVLTPTQVLELARKVKSSILFNNTSKTPYFKYFKDGKEHVVHFDDARSIRAKIELAQELNLNGISIWVLTSDFSQGWSTIKGLILPKIQEY